MWSHSQGTKMHGSHSTWNTKIGEIILSVLSRSILLSWPKVWGNWSICPKFHSSQCTSPIVRMIPNLDPMRCVMQALMRIWCKIVNKGGCIIRSPPTKTPDRSVERLGREYNSITRCINFKTNCRLERNVKIISWSDTLPHAMVSSHQGQFWVNKARSLSSLTRLMP